MSGMRSNVHTHTTWCDGTNTPEEMAQAALALGFTDLGFSSHAAAPFDPTCPGIADEAAYQRDIFRLCQQYAGRLDISLGLEQDTYAPAGLGGYHYLITSNHYLPAEDGQYVGVDGEPEMLRAAWQGRYGGDGLALAQAYYTLLVQGVERQKPTIVGHFDLIKKLNGQLQLFDEADERYRRMAQKAMMAVLDIVGPYGGMVEVNTGAMARGFCHEPYPSPWLMPEMVAHGARVIITTDSHRVDTLSTGYNTALALLRRAGFTRMAQLSGGAFVDVEI